jgi:hypothetical protein
LIGVFLRIPLGTIVKKPVILPRQNRPWTPAIEAIFLHIPHAEELEQIFSVFHSSLHSVPSSFLGIPPPVVAALHFARVF